MGWKRLKKMKLRDTIKSSFAYLLLISVVNVSFTENIDPYDRTKGYSDFCRSMGLVMKNTIITPFLRFYLTDNGIESLRHHNNEHYWRNEP